VKKCSKCEIDKENDQFHKHKKGMLGIDSVCKECKKQYQSLNKERIVEYQKAYYLNNKEAISIKNNLWFQNNREKDRNRYKKWYKNNKANKLEWKRNKMKSDVEFKIKENMRSRLYMALKGRGKKLNTEKYLGCSIANLKIHLESKFQPGMTWENWGLTGWHIDHIIPLAKFDLTKEESIFQSCHYSNLQPLWAQENLSKGSE